VIAVCGEPVLNLKQMYELVKQFHKEKDFIEFTLQCIGGCNASVAIDTSSADAVCEEIMSTYRIPSAVSAALLGPWKDGSSAGADHLSATTPLSGPACASMASSSGYVTEPASMMGGSCC